MPKKKQVGDDALVPMNLLIRKRHVAALEKEVKKSGGDLSMAAIVRQALDARLFKKRRLTDLSSEDLGKG